jgi:hypothetical protein
MASILRTEIITFLQLASHAYSIIMQILSYKACVYSNIMAKSIDKISIL